MKGWRTLRWICLLVGALNPSTFALRSQGSGRRASRLTSCILYVVLGWNYPSGHSGFGKLSKCLEGYWLVSLFLSFHSNINIYNISLHLTKPILITTVYNNTGTIPWVTKDNEYSMANTRKTRNI